MGSTSDRFPADPRYHDIYQRGGSSEPHTAAPSWSGGQETQGVESPTSARSDHRTHAAPSPTGHTRADDPSTIRELGVDDAPQAAPARHGNPFDALIWGSAAVLIGLASFLAFAPALYAGAIQEQMVSGMYVGHWSQQVSIIAVPLAFVGTGTAIAQLFVLSNRHARPHS